MADCYHFQYYTSIDGWVGGGSKSNNFPPNWPSIVAIATYVVVENILVKISKPQKKGKMKDTASCCRQEEEEENLESGT